MSLVTLEKLLTDLATVGGAIVSSNDCDSAEITAARASGRMYVRFDGYGLVRRPALWLEGAKRTHNERCKVVD